MPTVPSVYFSDSLTVPPVWIDSDAAADTAYYYAGYEFYARHPNAHTLAYLQMIDLSQPLLPKMMHSGIGNKEPTLTKQRAAQVTSSWQRQPIWLFEFFYDESMDFAYAMVDALSGRIQRYLLIKETSAMHNMSNVAGQAYLWAGDAGLVMVVSNDDGVDPSGLCRTWDYYFYSPSLNAVRKFIFSNGGFIDGCDVTDYSASKAVITGFEDSPLAFAVAEQNGGLAYRQANADCRVEAQLAYSLMAATPSRLIWKFTYQSAFAAPLVLYVDAYDNSFITDIASVPQTAPECYRLEQNYPNPFNAVTVFAYQLPREEEVVIDIIDVRGSILRTLAAKKQSAGTHRVIWDGTIGEGMPAASGIYFVRLQAGTRALTKKIMLLR